MGHRSRRTVAIFWRWYAALLLANALDLLFTYVAVERGFEELNPLLRPILLTPWPAGVKMAVLVVLACGLWQVVRHARHPGRTLSLLQGATAVYLIVVAIHVVGLYGRT